MATESLVSPVALAAAGELGSVRIEGVTRRFGDVVAVDDLTLSVEPGEFLTLLGPSGCGKTTTLRMVGGFEQADSGTIRIDGEDMGRRPPYRRPVNTVFQQYALFPHLSVAKNIGYGLRRLGVGRAEIRRRVDEAMEMMEIAGLGDRRPRQLSGGQQQRVALARALVMQPKVLLLDEPLGSLDYKLRKLMQFELKRIHREVGVTFVYVTHDQEEAMTMSDRICIMNGGRIEQQGAPEEIYDRPATRFAASFMGDTNFLYGSAVSVDGGRGVLDLGPVGRVDASVAPGVDAGGGVAASVRPEDVKLVPDADGPFTVTEAVLCGAHCLCKAESGSVAVTAQVAREDVLAPGSRVRLELAAGRVRGFGGEAT